MGYKYEFTWLLRLPVEELPLEPGEAQDKSDNLVLWRRSSGNIIMGFFREGNKLVYPVGENALIVTVSERAIGYGRIIKSEIHELPNGSLVTVVEFRIGRLFDPDEAGAMTAIFREMYGKLNHKHGNNA